MMNEEKINELKERLVKMSNLVRDMIDNSFEALIENKKELAEMVLGEQEDECNNYEIVLDDECIKILALQHPEAKQLRVVMMISKMISDIERMGDMACNIADSSIALIGKATVKPLIDLPRMKELTLKMLDDSIKCFVNNDTALAYDVIKRDEEVDSLRDQILRELITYMVSDGTVIDRSLHILRIARNLERMADLTTNISEDVIYIVDGKVVKHTGLKS